MATSTSTSKFRRSPSMKVHFLQPPSNLCFTKDATKSISGNSVTRALQKTAVVLFEVFHQLMRLHLEPVQQIRSEKKGQGFNGSTATAQKKTLGNNGKKLEKNAPIIRNI